MTAGDKVSPLRRDEQAVIRALLPAVAAMMRAFDADLNRAERMTHTEYLVLMFLSEAPERTLRLADLAAHCHKSPSAISRAVGRLEVDGLVRRAQASDDGRGANAILTDVGLARLGQARDTHVLSIRRHLMDHLEGVDLDALTRALESIANPGNSMKAPPQASNDR
ncbi:MarR family transcriptional regulator [Streptomyces sp. NBC_01352]|uniref:MarR family winged helix-turn-helix transcriptional regulator n=1 Tax=unclassified Streptomyces TaxID=2593676 RepID=UPI0022587723|nr:MULTISPECIES: MarR family transcriptional regulator [unclassified Streptomyces]MCX4706786.1 MarR family transcriptional regulator [Streptomyces sp. NBC_01373]